MESTEIKKMINLTGESSASDNAKLPKEMRSQNKSAVSIYNLQFEATR